MSNQGYIKLWRKIKDKSWWLRRTERATWTQAWIDLLLRANHKDAEIIIDEKPYRIPRGSCVISQRKIAKEWKWGIARVNAFFKFLANTEQSIRYKTEHGFTHIFILNWEKYQGQVEHQVEQKRNTNGMQMETNNNDKNEKNDNTTNDVVLNKLINCDLSYEKAVELINSYPLNKIKDILDEIEENPRIKSKTGFLLTALKEKWNLEKRFYVCEYGHKHPQGEGCGHGDEAKYKNL